MHPIDRPVLVPNQTVLTACAAAMVREVYEALPDLVKPSHEMLVIRPAPSPVSWFGVVPTARDGRYRLVELRGDGVRVRDDFVLERRILTILAREYRDYTMEIEVNRVDRARVADRFDAADVLLVDSSDASRSGPGSSPHDPATVDSS